MDEATEISARAPAGWRSFGKRRAFSTHLALSATIVGTVCALIFFVWYPSPYFEIRGAWNVLRVLIGVDLILGPLLTLILFRPNKPGLALDMTMIAMIQLSALVYGTAVIFQERPYYAVFAVDRFEVLAKRDVDSVAAARAGFTAKPLVGPMLVYASVPSDPAEFQQLLQETLFEGKPDIERRPDRWAPFADSKDAVLSRARPLSLLLDERPAAAPAAARLGRQLGRDPSELGYVPAVGADRSLTVIVNPETAVPLAVLDVDPWSS